ncbi:hypothetical protein KCU99_g339, partial [Aureobasidium melanogenum]
MVSKAIDFDFAYDASFPASMPNTQNDSNAWCDAQSSCPTVAAPSSSGSPDRGFLALSNELSVNMTYWRPRTPKEAMLVCDVTSMIGCSGIQDSCCSRGTQKQVSVSAQPELASLGFPFGSNGRCRRWQGSRRLAVTVFHCTDIRTCRRDAGPWLTKGQREVRLAGGVKRATGTPQAAIFTATECLQQAFFGGGGAALCLAWLTHKAAVEAPDLRQASS